MAAALLHRHCANNGLDVIVRSSGTHAGVVASDPDAVAVMAEQGLSIADHLPRLLTRAIAADDGADLMIAMTRTHLRSVALMGPGAFQRSFTAKELVRRAASFVAVHTDDSARTIADWRKELGEGRLARDLLGDDPDDDVSDPYGAGLALHRQTADELDALMAAVAHSIAGWQNVG